MGRWGQHKHESWAGLFHWNQSNLSIAIPRESLRVRLGIQDCFGLEAPDMDARLHRNDGTAVPLDNETARRSGVRYRQNARSRP